MIIGLDVGGTHTDVVLLDTNGLVKEIKVTTDPENLFQTVLSGLEMITQDFPIERIKRIVLSTTLTTNAIVQSNIPNFGMIVTAGPGVNPINYKTNDQYHVVSGAIDHRGREIEPVDEREIKKIGKSLKADGIEHVGIVGKFSSRNPDHEIKIFNILKDHFKKIFLGHWISGNLNFPRRIATTFLNAAVYPLHSHFFMAVRKSLDQKGLNIPIHILKADGGTMNFDSSMDFPGQTILSGPAASVMGSLAFAPAKEDVIVLDIGGTTTDIAVLIDRAPVLAPLGIELGSFKTLIRSLNTHSIGIGGDSAVTVEYGEIKIGPERRGQAMAFGGSVPTPTDAISILNPDMSGDREKAAAGIESIAKQINKNIEATAQIIFDKACKIILQESEAMVDRINSKPVYTVHELQEGYQVKPTKILVLGGPAPYFSKGLKNFSDMEVSPVPHWKVANAIGAALARTTCEVSLFADTQHGTAVAPEEDYLKHIGRDYSAQNAVKDANELLKQKALERGAQKEDLEVETLEHLSFNMVRGFYTTGKNIRVKVQVKPGLIQGYEKITQNL